MEQVDFYVKGEAEPVMSLMINLDDFDDKRLNQVLIDELCKTDEIFCSHCIGDVNFEIIRENNKVTIWPMQNGKPMTLFKE